MAQFSPSLADIRAIQSSDGVDVLCTQLLGVLRPSDHPLVVAKTELKRFGWDPPPISDEWWLDIIENQSEEVNSFSRRTWLFPLPDSGTSGGRGRSIAWTALQMAWEERAVRLDICQTTRPEAVLAFIADDPALAEVSMKHPDIVANYAPQLLIPGFSGPFETPFDDLVAKSEAKLRRNPDKRHPAALCEKHYALRRPDFGNHAPRDIADKWVNGRGFGESASHWHLTDYIIWLLSNDSAWLPESVRALLTKGMREWTAWDWELTQQDIWDQVLAKEIYGRERRQMRWTRSMRIRLENVVEQSLARLRVEGSASKVAQMFLDFDFIGASYDIRSRRLTR